MTLHRDVSRRAVLAGSLTTLAAGPVFGQTTGHDGMCHAAINGNVEPVAGGPHKVTIAWNENAVCVAAVPVAKEKGFFSRYNLDVDYVNFGGSTDQLLEAISTGKADAAPGMMLRWLKPLQQGFDVKLVAGLHAGCLYLSVPADSEVRQVADLKGKTIGVPDIGGAERNFFSIRLREFGLDPESDVSWRSYPNDLLPLALQRGDIQALSNSDPVNWLQKKQFGLRDIDSNMTGKWAETTCCVIGIRGGLIRNNPEVARAITAAILEAGAWLACNPDEAGEIFHPYSPKTSAKDLAAMIRGQGHHHQTLKTSFRDEVVAYADALKTVGIFRPSLDTTRYAERVTQDLFV